MKVLTIGDLHGRNLWKSYLFEVINDDMSCRFDKVDKVIFIGDYVDSFDKPNIEIFDNLSEIIDLKKKFPDKVVLLLGNHDYAYINGYSGISGFRASMWESLKEIFCEEYQLFDAAYLYGGVLWTHAGMSKKYLEDLVSYMKKIKIHDDIVEQSLDISEVLNLLKEYKSDSLYHYSVESGGSLPRGYAGPLWLRPKELELYGLDNCSQVVGHTVFSSIQIKNIENGHKLFFVDTITDNKGCFLLLEFLEQYDISSISEYKYTIDVYEKNS